MDVHPCGFGANRHDTYNSAPSALGCAVIPFTLLVILLTNKRLLDPGLDRRSAEAAELLDRWGRLHAVRSVVSALAFGLLVWHLAQQG